MDDVRKQQLQQIIELSKNMLEKIQTQAWDELPVLEQRRHQAMERFFAVPSGLEESEAIESGIREILAIDQEIVGLAKTECQVIAGNLRQLENFRKARISYQGNEKS